MAESLLHTALYPAEGVCLGVKVLMSETEKWGLGNGGAQGVRERNPFLIFGQFLSWRGSKLSWE